MFALALIAFLVLLAFASLAVVADSGIRWWSAFGLLKQQLAGDGHGAPQAPTGARRRQTSKSRLIGSHRFTRPAALRAAA